MDKVTSALWNKSVSEFNKWSGLSAVCLERLETNRLKNRLRFHD